MNVLTVCSANRCRSPMAAMLLDAKLADRECKAEVVSGGFGPPGLPAVPEAVAVLAEVGLDLSAHRSDPVTPDRCDQADLVVAMTRQHVIDVVLLAPACWPRLFPLVDLVRRGQQIGPVADGEDIDAWVRRVHGGRDRASVLALAADDDIADPVGGPRVEFERARERLDGLLSELARLLAPAGG